MSDQWIIRRMIASTYLFICLMFTPFVGVTYPAQSVVATAPVPPPPHDGLPYKCYFAGVYK